MKHHQWQKKASVAQADHSGGVVWWCETYWSSNLGGEQLVKNFLWDQLAWEASGKGGGWRVFWLANKDVEHMLHPNVMSSCWSMWAADGRRARADKEQAGKVWQVESRQQCCHCHQRRLNSSGLQRKQMSSWCKRVRQRLWEQYVRDTAGCEGGLVEGQKQCCQVTKKAENASCWKLQWQQKIVCTKEVTA